MNLRIFALALAMIFVASLAAQSILQESGTNAVRLTDSHDYGLRATVELHNLQTVTVTADRGTYTLLQADGLAWSVAAGEPRLPVVRKVIAVPLGASVTARVVNHTQEVVELGELAPVMPAQPSLSKSADPATVPFAINEALYATEAWAGNMGVTVEELGVLRGMRLFVLAVNPVEYNPVRNELHVWTEAEVEVNFHSPDFAATDELRARTWSPVFESAMAGSVFNYTPLQSRDDFTRYPQSMIIISDRMFEAQLQPFIEWKNSCGIATYVAYTDDIGVTTTSIHGYIEDLWDAATPENPAPSYVLFVGDTGQIPAYNGSTGSHVTDLNYVRLEGGDFMPEMLYGRFSASSTGQLQPQIDKTLMYEQYTMPDPSYLEEVVMIAGMDSSHGSTWGNGQINYGTTNYFNAAHGITSHTYLYPNSGSNSANIVSNVSDGVGYVNYTAHGSSTSWADPSFTIPNINSLQNENEYPMVVGNCCLTNKFEEPTCFGEAWLRAENKGAVGYIGGTNSTYWDEDYWWGVGSGNVVSNPTYQQTGLGVYDGLFHDHDEPFADWYTSTGSMILRGNLAVVEGGGSQNYYWEIYSLMGDPSLQPYMGVPTQNDADWPEQILIGLTQVTVDADPYSYVALSFDGETKAVGLVDATGSITLAFEPFTTPGDAQLVITAQNREPIVAAIAVIPNDGAYVVMDEFTVSGDDNGLPEYGEAFNLDLDVTNVGSDDAYNVTATLSTTDAYATITGGTYDIGTIEAEETQNLTEVFALELASNVPDQHVIEFTVTFSGEDGNGDPQTWVADLLMPAYAPSFQIAMYEVDDSAGNDNGVPDPGETVVISVSVTNAGHAYSPEALATMACTNPDITIESNIVDLGEFAPAQTFTASYTVTVAADAEPGSLVPVGFAIDADAYAGDQLFMVPVSVVAEDFENGLELYGWSMGGSAPWFLEQSTTWEGSYALQSGDVSNNQSSTAQVTMDVATDGNISFYYKVSSEPTYDFLRFFIDGQEQDAWSGNVDWTLADFEVTAGTHTFKWEYEKDYSQSNGSDCGWIDYVQLPSFGGEPAPLVFLPATTLAFGDVPVNTEAEQTLTIRNFGSEALSGSITTYEGFSIDMPATTRKADVSARSTTTREVYPFSVEPMSMLNVTVVFAPTQSNNYDGQFTIATNDTNAPELNVNVTANGWLDAGNEEVPEFVTALSGNYPNPFNPETTVVFSLATPQHVTIDIYNVLGQRVTRLVNDNLEKGEHKVVWRGTDQNGTNVASGVYFYKFDSSDGDNNSDYTAVKKMILLK